MRRRALLSAGCLAFVTVVTPLALAAPAVAKSVRIKPHVVPRADAPLTPEESEALARTLNLDASTLESGAPARRSFGAPSLAHPRRLAVSRNEHADGSSTVTVAQPLQSDWDVKVGADLDVAAAPAIVYEPDKPLPGAVKDNASSAAAWASLGVTRFATIDAHVDPGREQGTLGATLQHSVPLGHDMSVTLRSRYAVSDTLAAPAEHDDATSVLNNDQSVRLDIGSTGTTLSAGVSASSADPVAHNTLRADQKIYGPLHVSTAVTDPGEATSNKSVTAGFKLTW